MLTVCCPGGLSGRLAQVFPDALHGRDLVWCGALDEPLSHHLLFAVCLDEGGENAALRPLLSFLRTHPGCLNGCVGGVVVDGCGEWYTKSVGRELILAASLAGCVFPGRSLVEATGSLQNFTVQARNAACSLEDAYRLAIAQLVQRMESFSLPRQTHPRLLALHASNHQTSNTLALWRNLRQYLEPTCAVTEINLRNGAVEDCAGCPYTTCLHFGEQGRCFYGGVMVQDVYPALREADALMLLCPNYNDALSANLTAAVNRMTALYRAVSFADKAVFAVVVSGYSGGDIVASQVVSALSLNKGFWLPAQFCLSETANDAGTVLKLPGIDDRVSTFAKNLLVQLT